MPQKPELVCPAGDKEKLHMAVLYGADAVYVGGSSFSLRAAADNFTWPDLVQATGFAHKNNVRIYVAANIYAYNRHLDDLRQYFYDLATINIDAVIVSDPGVLSLAREAAPGVDLHLSTQANCTNVAAASFWQEQGIKRIILARELAIAEAAEFAPLVETEVFIHGAMCMAYSGRCFLSSYLTGRSANLGDCAHPCRWNYLLKEAKCREGLYPVEEDENGTYIFNSRDLCLIDCLPELMRARITAYKIEGRMKSAYYVANVTRIYREAIDYYCRHGPAAPADPLWREELLKVSNRGYCEGFAHGYNDGMGYYQDNRSLRQYDFAGVVLAWQDGKAYIEQRNHIAIGDELDIITPHEGVVTLWVTELWDEAGQPVTALPHPKMKAYLACSQPLPAGAIIRRKVTV